MDLKKELIRDAFLTKEQIHSFVFAHLQKKNLIKGKNSSVEEMIFCFEEMFKLSRSDKFLNGLTHILDDFSKKEIKEILKIYKNKTFIKFINKTENIYLPVLAEITKLLDEISKKQPPIVSN